MAREIEGGAVKAMGVARDIEGAVAEESVGVASDVEGVARASIGSVLVCGWRRG